MTNWILTQLMAQLTNGNGTTANGTAVDLGGASSIDITITNPSSENSFRIGGGDGGNFNIVDIWAVDSIGVLINSGNRFIISTAGVALDIGSDATGDIYYRTSTGFFQRLPIGEEGQVLKVVSGLPQWSNP